VEQTFRQSSTSIVGQGLESSDKYCSNSQPRYLVQHYDPTRHLWQFTILSPPKALSIRVRKKHRCWILWQTIFYENNASPVWMLPAGCGRSSISKGKKKSSHPPEPIFVVLQYPQPNPIMIQNKFATNNCRNIHQFELDADYR